MGSFIETNDTLQITREQGFPTELDLEKHKVTPFKTEDFVDKVFEFKNKPSIRVYQQPPIRVFFVENVNSKWIYWGLCQILEITHDYVNKTTSGKYKITYINTLEEMKQIYNLTDRRPDTNYFE